MGVGVMSVVECAVLSVALMGMIALSIPCTKALFVDRQSPIREVIMRDMTPTELHHYFGNATDPVFHLARPRLVPLNTTDRAPPKVRLTISSADFHLDAVLTLSEGLLAPHLITEGVTVDGETVNLQQLLCHYRGSNATHVVSANNCDGDGVDGIIVAPDDISSLHPLPPRLLSPLSPLLPCSYSDPAPEGTYGLHILHLTPKRITGEGRSRTRRETMAGHDEDKDDEEEHLRVCATGPEHYVKGVTFRRPPRFRDLRELTGNLDLQAPGSIRAPVHGGPSPPLMHEGHLEDHNHTITAEPVSAVLRRTVELAVFCDSALYQDLPPKFNSQRQSQLINYVLTIINAVQGIYHQDELQGYVVNLRVVELDIFTGSGSRNYPSPSGGDIGAYLSSFCAWQQNINPSDDSNPKHWDHALMLSGLDLHSSGNPSVIGLAWVGGMCRPSHSCTMNEGRDFSTVYVVAHEMGHNFGMNHDGQGDASGCSSSNYIMSPSVGPGKTTWSTCSTKVIHSFLRKSTCLDDGAAALGAVEAEDTDREGRSMNRGQNGASLKHNLKPQEIELDSLLRKTPGFWFPLQEQCKAMYGRDYHPALTKDDLCKYLYCTNGVVTRPAHPALEGSFCGTHRVCIAGKCKPEKELVSLVGYNIPASDTPSEPQSTPPSSLEDILQPAAQSTSTLPGPPNSAALMMPCLEDPSPADSAVPRKPCINNTLAETPTSCDCSPQTAPPADIDSIPKEICPFLAPVYHELFKCSSECPLFDLHLDLTSGNLTQMLTGPNLLNDLSKSCIFDHYSVIRGQGTDTVVGSIPHVSQMDPEVCKGLPQFLHPSLGCPYVGSKDQEHDCIPQNIVVKTSTKRITYTQSQGQTHRSILWRGTRYSLRTVSDDGHQDSTNSHIFTIHTGDENLIINCNLEAIFPDVLQNVPSDVCPFIAPILHDLFNCSERDHCTDYVVIISLQEHNITKIPVLKDLPRGVSCPACAHERKGIEAILSEIIQAVIHFLSESTFICKLLPGSLSAFIPGCSSAPALEAISEDMCPPLAVVVETGTTAFTYSLDTKRHGTDLPQLKWHGRLFNLHGISTDKDSLLVLREKFSLHVDNSVTRGYDYKEMEVMSRHRNNVASLKSANPAGDSHHHYTTHVHLADGPLVEYIGQSDKFLPLNAPMAMPRTKVGECSVTCGRGVRTVEQECVDVLTEEVLDNDSCQGYAVPKPEKEPCVLPDCLPPQWKVGEWGECQQCGTGVQFRKVQCVIPALELQAGGERIGVGVETGELVTSPVLVVEDQQCGGERPLNVQGCHKVCPAESITAEENIEIAKDFDY